MQEFFEEVREAALRGIWSKGVELSRGKSVFRESESDGEITCRVVPGTSGISVRVTLRLEDGDWISECRCAADPCEHVVAATIALKKSKDANEPLPELTETGIAQIVYKFTTSGTALSFSRVLREGDREVPVRGTLRAIAQNGLEGLRAVPAQEDYVIESALGGETQGVFSQRKWSSVGRALAKAERIELDGQSIRFSDEPIGICAVVEDDGPGVRIRGEQHPDITRVFANGIADCRGLLRPISDFGLAAAEVEMLTKGERFGAKELGDFASVTLPALQKKLPVIIKSRNLPSEEDYSPRVVPEWTSAGDTLGINLAIQYGEPPIGKVVDGRYHALAAGTVPFRNLPFESQLLAAARESLGLAEDASRFTGEAAVNFAERAIRWQPGMRDEALREFRMVGNLEGKVYVEGESFDLGFSAPAPGGPAAGRADPAAVMRAWIGGQSMVRLIEGGWAKLPLSWLASYGSQIQDLLAARDDKGALVPAAKLDFARLLENSGAAVPESAARLGNLLKLLESPDHVSTTAQNLDLLRDYQQKGVNWIRTLGLASVGGILADDMGLGKTVQAIYGMNGKALVICPKSVVTNWIREIARFRPELKAAVYHGAERRIDRNEVDVYVTTFGMLRNDVKLLSGELWDTIIVDESQNIKNPESKVAQAAFSLTGKLRLCLTGTPVENSLEDLWSQLNFANPGFLGSRRFFQEKYMAPREAQSREAILSLRRRIAPFILRRTKGDVALELPSRTTVVLRAELSAEERQIYDAVLLATRNDVVASLKSGGSVIQALELLLRLRQACCSSALVPGQRSLPSAKIGVLQELLSSSRAVGSKTLVFSQWTSYLDEIGVALESEGIQYLRIDGKTSDRQAVVDQFSADPSITTMLLSLKAAGVGLNLTAADHVIIMDPWWNPFAEDQAADRAHRIGQTKPVLIQKIVAEGTVEERILDLQDAKRGVADQLLGQANGGGELTRENLLDLLS
jgi:superfamily II DNA or RNA helicase